MSQEETKQEPRLYSYNDTTINAVLAYLGKKPAEEVIGLINNLLKPQRVEAIPEAKSVTAEVVEQA